MIQLVSLLPNVIHTDLLINTKLFLQHLLLLWVISYSNVMIGVMS
jgi:hypothetical protein